MKHEMLLFQNCQNVWCFDQSSCCFGKIPEPNEWVVVDMTAKEGGPILMDQLVEIDGKIEVEEKWEEGFFVGIYHVSANTVQKSK